MKFYSPISLPRSVRFAAIMLVASFGGKLQADNVAPVVAVQLPDTSIAQGAVPQTVDLTSAFNDPDVRQAVRMTTSIGTIDVALFDQQTPVTVANFLKYVNQHRYNPILSGQQATSFFHRSVPGFVIQGGGYVETPTAPGAQTFGVSTVQADQAIQNEPGISNVRGTIAMAKAANDPNSATSQWFFNLADNSATLNTQNGGFTVFGRVAGTGLTTVDAIAAVPTFNQGSPFDQIPLINYTPSNPITIPNLVLLSDIEPIAPLRYTATSDNPNISVSVSGTMLSFQGSQPGTGHIAVTAIDLDGANVSQSFSVTVTTSQPTPTPSASASPSPTVSPTVTPIPTSTPSTTPAPTAPGITLGNISTRLSVGTGDNVLIGGFIINGTQPKKVLVRAAGPSLTKQKLAGALANPMLALVDGTGKVLATNDDWQTDPNASQIPTSLQPGDPKDSAVLTTLQPGNYTSIVSGVGGATGIALVEAYDLDQTVDSKLANISTRGFVQTGDNVMIGGLIVQGSAAAKVIIRGRGPSLSGVANPLLDPTLAIFDGNGTAVANNDNWQTDPGATEMQSDSLAPTDPREAATLQTLAPGNYTAIISGVNNSTGVGLVEVYNVTPAPVVQAYSFDLTDQPGSFGTLLLNLTNGSAVMELVDKPSSGPVRHNAGLEVVDIASGASVLVHLDTRGIPDLMTVGSDYVLQFTSADPITRQVTLQVLDKSSTVISGPTTITAPAEFFSLHSTAALKAVRVAESGGTAAPSLSSSLYIVGKACLGVVSSLADIKSAGFKAALGVAGTLATPLDVNKDLGAKQGAIVDGALLGLHATECAVFLAETPVIAATPGGVIVFSAQAVSGVSACYETVKGVSEIYNQSQTTPNLTLDSLAASFNSALQNAGSTFIYAESAPFVLRNGGYFTSMAQAKAFLSQMQTIINTKLPLGGDIQSSYQTLLNAEAAEFKVVVNNSIGDTQSTLDGFLTYGPEDLSDINALRGILKSLALLQIP